MSDHTPEISLETYAAERDAALTVDVRERREYAEGHVPGALLIPMGELAARVDELDREARVHVICASGNRSKAVTQLLRSAGFDAVSVAGGTRGWIRSGRGVSTSTG